MLDPRTVNVGFVVDIMVLWVASLGVLLFAHVSISQTVLCTQTLYNSSSWQPFLERFDGFTVTNHQCAEERKFLIPSSDVNFQISLLLNTVTEHGCWTRLLNIVTEHCYWTRLLNMVTEHCYWTRLMNTVTEHGYWTRLLNTVTEHGYWTLLLNTVNVHGYWIPE